MHHGTEPSTSTHSTWADRPTTKQRLQVQREVVRLFDTLAPEKAPARGAVIPVPVQRHRSPRGCVLQAPSGAVSLSWFAAQPTDATFGELQIVEWEGVVSLPGSASRSTKAAVSKALVLLEPVLDATGVCSWRTADGALRATDDLAERCRAFLLECEGMPAPLRRVG